MCYCYLFLKNLFIFHFRSKQVVIKKILADQAVAAPFFAVTFIFGAGLLEGNSLSKIFIFFFFLDHSFIAHNDSLGSCWSEFKNKFPTIYMFDWLIWPPTQGINFLYVPAQYR